MVGFESMDGRSLNVARYQSRWSGLVDGAIQIVLYKGQTDSGFSPDGRD